MCLASCCTVTASCEKSKHSALIPVAALCGHSTRPSTWVGCTWLSVPILTRLSTEEVLAVRLYFSDLRSSNWSVGHRHFEYVPRKTCQQAARSGLPPTPSRTVTSARGINLDVSRVDFDLLRPINHCASFCQGISTDICIIGVRCVRWVRCVRCGVSSHPFLKADPARFCPNVSSNLTCVTERQPIQTTP